MKRFRELGKTLEELKAMDPKEVETAFYPLEDLERTEKPLPDFFGIHNQMMVMKHPDLSYLWLDYKEKHPDGYQPSRFYKLYKEFCSENLKGIHAGGAYPGRVYVHRLDRRPTGTADRS